MAELPVVSIVRLRRLLARPRHRVAIVLALLALGGAVGAHHAVPMTDMQGMGSTGGVCVAVLGLGLGLAIVHVIRALRLRLRPPPTVACQRTPRTLAPRPVFARAGPRWYLTLAVIRR